MGIWI